MDNRGICWEDGKGEEYLNSFHFSVSTDQCGVHHPCHSTGKVLHSSSLPSPQYYLRCIGRFFPVIRGYMTIVHQPFSIINVVTEKRPLYCE